MQSIILVAFSNDLDMHLFITFNITAGILLYSCYIINSMLNCMVYNAIIATDVHFGISLRKKGAVAIMLLDCPFFSIKKHKIHVKNYLIPKQDNAI